MILRKSIFAALVLSAPCAVMAGASIAATGTALIEGNNPLQIARRDQMVEIPASDLADVFSRAKLSELTVIGPDSEICSQSADRDADGAADTLLFAADFKPGEKRTFEVQVAGAAARSATCRPRAHAELSERIGGRLEGGRYVGGRFESVDFQRAPAHHKPQDMLYKFEGPGWESDKVAYRLYFDSRNTTDIFGKTTTDMVLPRVGVQEDNYHTMLDWGMDILKVGESLGIGAIGMQLADGVHKVKNVRDYSARILQRGPLRAQVQMQYSDWQLADAKYQLISNYSIDAGSRLTRADIQISGEPSNLVTGIVRHPAAEVMHSPVDASGWGYLASYGDQSYIDDGLGMAVFFRKQDLIKLDQDAHSELVVLHPQGGALEYYFLAAWVQEPGGIRNQEAFRKYLDEVLIGLNNPIQVKISGGNNE